MFKLIVEKLFKMLHAWRVNCSNYTGWTWPN